MKKVGGDDNRNVIRTSKMKIGFDFSLMCICYECQVINNAEINRENVKENK